MPRILWTFGFLLTASSFARAQPGPIVLPKIGVPPDFSRIAGKYQKPRVSANPTEVHVEQAIRLELRLIGVGPEEHEPDRKNLRQILPRSLDNDFYVDELRDEHRVLRDEKTWLFAFQLKPKHTKVEAIDDIKLVTYDPSSRKFVSQYADRIRITVRPKPDVPAPIAVPADLPAAPAAFYEAVPVSIVRSAEGVPIAGWHVAAFLVLTPFLCVLGIVGYRRFFPNVAVLKNRFRNEAALRARARLREGAELASVVVSRYLHERFGFSASDAAPAEVARFLHRRGFARSVSEQARAFFQACDADRFTPHSPTSARSLNEIAEALIQAMEADPCAR